MRITLWHFGTTMKIPLALVTLITALALGSLIRSPAARGETRILFCSDKQAPAGQFEFYSVRADGTDLRRLTSTAQVSEWAPALAPDGRRLAYVAREGGALMGTLHLSDLEGGPGSPLGTEVQALSVQWASDTTLYYLGYLSNRWDQPYFDVRKINTDGTGEARVYPGPFWVWRTGADSFALARVPGRLYFSTTSDVPGEFGVRPVAGELSGAAPDTVFARCIELSYEPDEPKVPGDFLIDHYDLAVSQDDALLAYVADHGSGVHRLYVRDLAGDCTTQRRLSSGYCGDPDFAPDGSFVVFTRAATSTFGAAPYLGDLIRISPDGTQERDLTSGWVEVAGRCAHPLVYRSAGPPCAPFTLQIIAELPTDPVRIVWASEPGVSYQVEHSADLLEWHRDLAGSSLTAKPGETEVAFSDPGPRDAPRFCRVVAACTP